MLNTCRTDWRLRTLNAPSSIYAYIRRSSSTPLSTSFSMPIATVFTSRLRLNRSSEHKLLVMHNVEQSRAVERDAHWKTTKPHLAHWTSTKSTGNGNRTSAPKNMCPPRHPPRSLPCILGVCVFVCVILYTWNTRAKVYVCVSVDWCRIVYERCLQSW